MYETFNLFAAIALAIFIEAMPFLVIGALFSSFIEVFVSTQRLLGMVPKNIAGGLALGIGSGFVLPTCECGVVPIVRRLMSKGVPPYIAIAYMLAAPIVNPVVLASTYIAFRGSFSMVFARIGLAVIVAAIVALISRQMASVVKPLKVRSDKHDCDNPNHTHIHQHEHSHDHTHNHTHEPLGKKIVSTFRHAAVEFMDMGKYLILGALIAAAFKTFLPENAMAYFSGNLALSIAGMMLLAILLSICSEADAFVAASFVGFPVAAQLAFIGIGPMVDLKLIGMYGITFKRLMVVSLLVVPFIIIYLASLLIGSLDLLSF
ncbi:permease [Carboxylicivirga marina]|uniref:Permease n=1 Tax=Carboxylicivirga marina TaxID=2800988 RepID=A0ABS1HK04_9BACT|nr:permease [Carboxylicivirga marina]MBK3517800.1 permease [Carboxylicivirga marina]